jgi:rod shape determining protein RodA
MIFSSSAIVDFFKKYDFSFFIFSAVIFIFGVINLYSATHSSSYMSELYKTQIGWYVLSFVIGLGVSLFSPKFFYRYSYAIYFFNLVLLVLVLILGHEGMGAQRWLVIGPFRFQPSEMMKISAVLALARWFSKHNVDQELGMKELIIPFIIAFIPTLLIVLEPDLGTGLLILLIFLVIAFYRKLKWKTILIIAVLGAITGGLMYQYGLKNYQKRRISTFLDPTADARGSGYNAIQSKIAIGSGKISGKGFKKSSQASLNYLPENHTDFVFSIYNEEHGFIGSLLLITVYIILLFRFIWLSQSVTRMFDSIMGIGLMSIFFWHTFINMGMVMGLMPVVGLPLPLMSYGGSSLLTFGICCGLATSLSNARNLF